MNKTTLCVATVLAFAIGGCVATTPAPEEPPSLTYEAITKWHKQGGLAGSWRAKEYHIDLNDDKKDEVLLAISGFNKGMTYALFTHTDKGWVLLSSEIDGSHTNPLTEDATHAGWHDFNMVHPTGHGGEWLTVYTWNGKGYVKKSTVLLE